jgi:hypothetical protein
MNHLGQEHGSYSLMTRGRERLYQNCHPSYHNAAYPKITARCWLSSILYMGESRTDSDSAYDDCTQPSTDLVIRNDQRNERLHGLLCLPRCPERWVNSR